MTRGQIGATFSSMLEIFGIVVRVLRAAMLPRASLVAENLALRQQLAALMRDGRRPRLRARDRAFWVFLSRVWSRWSDVLVFVKPATVIGWHRRRFARFWAEKSRPLGRPPIASEIIELIEQMARENPLWSRRRIAAELAKLGHDVAKDTVAKYVPPRRGTPRSTPSQTWGTFIRNHINGTIAIDFLTVPTVRFGIAYVFFVLSLARRHVVRSKPPTSR